MARNGRRNSRAAADAGANPGGARRPRSIRFSDSEWQKIEDAALRHGVSAGEIVRTSALAAAERRLDAPPPATVSPGHLALIEETFRFVYIMATLRRVELLDAARGKELDEIVAEARRVMTETMAEGPA